MTLAAGLILFFGVHLVPLTPLRERLVARLGERRYRGAFSLVAISGVVLMWTGFPRVPVEQLFSPVPWARPALLVLMPVVLVLLAAANMPSRIRQHLRNPMMIGTLVWAVLHFLANGDRAGSWLFGTFVVFSLASLATSSWRVAPASAREPGWRYDARAAIGGLVAYAVLVWLHRWLFGVAIL